MDVGEFCLVVAVLEAKTHIKLCLLKLCSLLSDTYGGEKKSPGSDGSRAIVRVSADREGC